MPKIDKSVPPPRNKIIIPFSEMPIGIGSVVFHCKADERYRLQIILHGCADARRYKKSGGKMQTAFVGPDREKPYHEKKHGVRVWRTA